MNEEVRFHHQQEIQILETVYFKRRYILVTNPQRVLKTWRQQKVGWTFKFTCWVALYYIFWGFGSSKFPNDYRNEMQWRFMLSYDYNYHNATFVFLFLFWLMTSDDQTSIHSSGDALSHQHRKWLDDVFVGTAIGFSCDIRFRNISIHMHVYHHTIIYNYVFTISAPWILATWFKPWPFYPRKFGGHLASLWVTISPSQKGQRIARGMVFPTLGARILRGGGVQGEGATGEP